ncbi:undecaprenyl-diphosphate phosphatase [Paenactinomyces guangxiensis]|uniref:Undecaprenyl-diphosphatase n=1 Tax=Paenactinomyces guangxiensis TaxID=1490290 RepID=A0A7W1WNB2_9BACL|nr:undecaprenyl-diphosphate phosphatase [Paenactinomyces guangxiensis]MBA4493027.1 undecaprenyl-diphosphate phosphatase [Paenactinomyces guangxiensis]MBH8590124.1 undecaprenyl-diphosphate phosphatase [Paenactinomyces guangxiensis]
MNWWDIFVGFILGCVEGLTEFAPVSSTGHMILTKSFLGISDKDPVVNTLIVVIQLASILAVVFVFWKRLLSLVGLYKVEKLEEDHTYKPGMSRRQRVRRFNLLHVLIGIIPAGITGVLLKDMIKEHLFGNTTVLLALVAGGILMIVAEKVNIRVTAHTLDDLTYKQAFYIGLIQCLSLWPGFSRSGSTIAGGILVGCNHKTAAEFTFIMAVPIMVGATTLDLIDSWSYLSASDLPLFVSGFITAFVVALLAIKFFLDLIGRVKLTPFAIYRFVLALLFWLIMM